MPADAAKVQVAAVTDAPKAAAPAEPVATPEPEHPLGTTTDAKPPQPAKQDQPAAAPRAPQQPAKQDQAQQAATEPSRSTVDGRRSTETPQAKPAAVTQPTADSGQPTQPTQPTQTPSAPAAAASRPASQAPATSGVRLPHAPEAVENTIRIAQARGVTHARLALRPAELGGLEIHLRSTANGLVARVTADVQQAAQVLQQAGDDLRRLLQAQGIDLQRLDIGVAGDPGHGAQAGAAKEQQANAEGRREGGGDSPAEDGASADAQARDTIELPDGVLVDVLA